MAWQAAVVEFSRTVRTDLVRLQGAELRVVVGSEVALVRAAAAPPSVRSLVRIEGYVHFDATHEGDDGSWVVGSAEADGRTIRFAMHAHDGAILVPTPASSPPAVGEVEWNDGWCGDLLDGDARVLTCWTRGGRVVGTTDELLFPRLLVGGTLCARCGDAFVGYGPGLERMWTRDDLGKWMWTSQLHTAGGNLLLALEHRFVALSPRTGDTVWEVPVLGTKNGLYTASSGDDRVTIQADGQIYVLEASSGRLLAHLTPTLGKEDVAPNYRDDAYALGDAILYVPYAASRVRVFRMDGSREADLVLPNDHFIETLGVVLGGTLVASTKRHAPGIGTSTFGLLIARETEALHDSVVVEPRPPVKVEALKQPDGKVRYAIAVDEQDFERFVRFARIEIKELAHVRGAHVWGDPKLRNRKFDGHIVWRVTGAGLTEDQKKVVEWAARDAEQSARVFAKAGDGKADIHVAVEYV